MPQAGTNKLKRRAWREWAFNTSEGPGPCGDSYTESTSKALMPWGLDAGFCPVFPAQIPQFRRGSGAPLFPGSPLPTKVQGPTQEKNVYSKADSSKGVGAGTLMVLHVAFFSKALPQGKASICLQWVECLLHPLPSQQAK